MSKKVTILIPVYNGSNYLKEAIDSALAQTYKNIEVIVVNDGSNDDGKTKAIAESYGTKIKYYEKENGGVSTALNLGIEKMTGDYLCWLSHDDKYYPNKVERQIKELEKYDDKTILYSNFALIDENGEKFNEVYYDHEMLTKKPDYAVLRGAIGGITLLIPKQALKDCGNFKEELRCTQDYDMWFRMLDKYTFRHMEEVLTMTRIHRNQDTNTSPRVLTEGNKLWINITENYKEEKKIEYEGSTYLFYKEMENYLLNTPYKEAIEYVGTKAKQLLEQEKEKMVKTGITVVIIDDGNKKELEKTIDSLKKQTLKNVKIIIEGKTKKDKIINTKNREETLKKIETPFFTFITNGTLTDEKWLEEELLIAQVSNKAICISNYNRPNRNGVINNYKTLLIPIDGIIFNNNYKIEYKEEYKNYLLYLYDLAKVGGIITTQDNHFLNYKETYNMTEVFGFLQKILSDTTISEHIKASLCYDITCIYNKYAKTNKKVYMYEPCDELKTMMYSRSFQLLKKYMDYKKAKKEKKDKKISEQTK